MIEANALAYRFPEGGGVGPIDLAVRPGAIVVFTGPTGAGKSLLLRALAGLAGRHGRGALTGDVRVDGRDPAALAPAERVRCVAFAGQVADDQLVAGTVEDEVAFGPDAARLPADVDGWLARTGVPGPGHRPIEALSGGERHRLLVAAVLAAGARALLLDEPLAHLDADGARALVATLRSLADEGRAVVVAEHRLAFLWGAADRIVLLDGGRVVADAPPAAFPPDALAGVGLWRPDAPETEPAPSAPPGPVVARWEGEVRRDGAVVLAAAVEVRRGERIAVVGPNGAGKSTLLGALATAPGALLVPQDADLALFRPTVREEIAYGPEERGLPDVPARVAAIARATSLDALLDATPQALSRGQRLRVAVAGALACEPAVLLLDEPTSGQDPEPVARLFDALVDRGATVVFSTHDAEVARRYGTRTIALSGGRVVSEGASGGPQPGPARPPPAFPAPGGLDPRARVLLVLAAATLVAAIERPYGLAVLLAGVLGAVLLARPTAADLVRASALFLAVAWATTVSQALFYSMAPRTPWFEVGPLVVWREGVRYGLSQSLRYAVLLGAGLALVASTSADRLLGALVRLGVPYGAAFLAASALRFAPVVARETLVVRAARRARGRPAWRRAPWAWWALEVALVAPIAARAVRRAHVLAEALDARGFDPLVAPAPRRAWAFGARDAAALGAAGLAAAGAVGLRAAYALYTADLAWSPALLPLYAFARRWL